MSSKTSNNKTITKKAYANIALIKYWGKKGRQVPLNPSLSILIPQCYTSCSITYKESTTPGLKKFLFENKRNDKFEARIAKYLKDIVDVCPIVEHYELSVETSNNFPHSAGIASSASAFAAISKCLVAIEKEQGLLKEDEIKRASFLARLGSGSACRSITDKAFTIWGHCEAMKLGDNHHTEDLDISEEALKKLGWPLLDSILVVSSKEKETSSSAGHQLMNTHIYKEARIAQANENLRVAYSALRNGDIATLGDIIENEALSLHALMMTSYPSFCLLHPHTLTLIDKIRNFRKETETSLYFTIDAGPNIHLLYPLKAKKAVENFIKTSCMEYTENIIWGKSIES